MRLSRAVALVAFLAVHAGSPQPRQRIAGLFWPDSADPQALTNLRRELHQLRQLLGDEPSLVVTSADLCWRDSGTCRVDLRVFGTEREAALAAAAAGDDEGILVHAGAAIAEYRGDLLPGAYEDWLLDARSQIERQCVRLCDLLGETRARAGDLAGAAEVARRRIQLQPLEEVGYRALMQWQADLGDRAGAVSTYHQCASLLERELGVVPDPATEQVFERLMARSRSDGLPVHPVAPAAGRSGPVAAQLVGRSAELGLLQDAWRAAVGGSPGLVMVRGGAGVGKTRLVAEVAEQARVKGAVVASSRCFGTSGRLALAPVADWLRAPAVQSAVTTLDPAWRAEAGRLLPAEDQAGRGTGPRAMVDGWQRHRFYEGMARGLLAVGRPLLLVLDNMHWCDQETLAFVTFCLGLADGSPLLVAGTLRDDDLEEEPELGEWAMRMRATGLLTEMSLSPLDAAATASLAQAISGRPLPEADTSLLHAATGGFPLYVIEAVRGSTDRDGTPLPADDLAAVLRRRLDQPTVAAREVAGLAAAVGKDFTLDLLTEASDLEADIVVEAVDELWRRRILRDAAGGYDFSHDLLRDVAYAGVSPPKRWLLHRRIAQSLELLHAGDTDAVAAQLAEQYARGGRGDRALAYYRRAAAVAASRFAHVEAIRLHRESLSIIAAMRAGRDRDSRELAVLEAMAAPLNARFGYASPELEHALERSMALAESLGRKDSVVTGLVSLWGSRFVQGRTADSYRLANRALALVDADSELRALVHFAVGGAAVSLGMPAVGLRHLESAGGPGGDTFTTFGTRPDIHGGAFAAHAHWLLGHDAEALACCDRVIEMARAADDPYNLALALGYGAVADQMRGDVSRLRKTVGELRRLCDRYHFAYYREWALVLDGWSRADKAGVELARRGIRTLKAQGSFARMPYWLALLAELLAASNRPDAARATLDAALAAARAHDDLWWLPEVMRMRAAYDGEQAAIARLRSAAQVAAGHGSAGLLRRCERDLRARGVRLPARGGLLAA
ncbi:MAG TPA: AAA family ATPase [Streptosporangiaceae bacterium]|nr:AAA family ATPase [Streptosporangiaceae bacterium]